MNKQAPLRIPSRTLQILSGMASTFGIIALCLPSALQARSTSNGISSIDSPSTLYRLTLDSIGCSNSESYRALLAGQLAASSLTFADSSRDSQVAVNSWCSSQLGRRPSSSDMKYCREKYQPEMNRFLAKALLPNAYRHESATFTWRKRVSPDCKLSGDERTQIVSLKQQPERRKRLPASEVTTPESALSASAAQLQKPAASVQATPYGQKQNPNVPREVPLVLPVSPELTQIPSESRRTLSETQDSHPGFFARAAQTASNFVASAVGVFTLPAGEKHGSCPLAAQFAEQIKNHTLLKNHPCSGPAPYNQSLLDEIFRVHEELEAMKKAYPNSTIAKKRGGGYRQGRGDGFNVQVLAGDKVLFPADPNANSFCSAAFITVFLRTVGRIDNGRIFSQMTPKQMRNFKERTDDDHGLYGTLNNDGNGIWDLNQRMGKYPIGETVGKFRDPKALANACAGDMMQWDRSDSKYGHEGVFLGRADGKTYFWSANQGTEGYGVTCENEYLQNGRDRMYPKIVRLTKPENLAAIPEYTGKSHLAGDFRPDLLERMLASAGQNSTPANQYASTSSPRASGPAAFVTGGI